MSRFLVERESATTLAGLLLLCSVLSWPTTSAAQPAQSAKKPAIDRYGDPLPPGAIARLGTVRFRTLSRFVPNLAFSPDAKLLASSTFEGRVCLWEVATGKLIHRLSTKHQAKPAFSKDGKVFTSAGVYWNVADGKEIKALDAKDLVLQETKKLPDGAQAVSADGKFLAGVRGHGTIFVRNRATGKETCTFEGHDACLLGLAFAPGGRTLATSAEDGTVRLWEPSSGRLLQTFSSFPGNWVRSVAFSPDGTVLAAPVADGDIRNRVQVGLQAWSRVVIRRWEPTQGKELKSWVTEEPDFFGSNLAFAPDGKTLALSTPVGIRIYSSKTGIEVRRFDGPRNSGGSIPLAYSPDSRMLATPADEGLFLWDAGSGKQLKQFKQFPNLASVAFSRDGKIIAAGDNGFDLKSSIKLWDVGSGKELATFTGPRARIVSLSFSPDGKILASAAWDGGGVRLWDLARGKEFHRLEVHDGPLTAIAFSPDGKTLGSAGIDTTALIWDMTDISRRLQSKAK